MTTFYILDDNSVYTGKTIEKSEYEPWGAKERKEVPPVSNAPFLQFNGVSYDELEAYPTPAPQPIQVPQSITMGQFRAGLIITGLDTQVQAVIDSIPDELQRKLAQSDFEYRTEIDRNHPLILQLSPVLNLTDEEVDQYFIGWSKL